MLGTILLVILIVILLGGFRDWGSGPGYGLGRMGVSVPGLLILVLVILLLMGRI